jgi:hypothetical protein
MTIFYRFFLQEEFYEWDVGILKGRMLTMAWAPEGIIQVCGICYIVSIARHRIISTDND